MAHSKLPQQLDISAEHGVQVEYDQTRKVLYVHVDGYTALRVNRVPRIRFEGDVEAIVDSTR